MIKFLFKVVQVNENYLKLKAGYLFPEIAKRVKKYSQTNTSSNIIKLGIGDVTEPLPRSCRDAMGKALNDMGTNEGFMGYGPEQGYSWLREKISEHDFISKGCKISPEEIFVSDGSKCDSSNILDILGKNNSIAVTDPVYPAIVEMNKLPSHASFFAFENVKFAQENDINQSKSCLLYTSDAADES